MNPEKKQIKAVSLLSGGLDSTLATVVVQRMGIDVTAVTFLTPFGCDAEDRSSCSHNAMPAARKYGFTLKMCHLGEKFIEIVKDPAHGHGKNMNPCIDCRILMLREAKILMEMIGAAFIVTGEVIGQRPMSQKRNTLRMIEKRAGVPDLVLRPLSGKLLPETLPEQQGLVNRDLLYDFNGRSRKEQMALATRLGIDDYPAPAGGCLLTDPTYSTKLRNFLRFRPDVAGKDLRLLGVGRQFMTPDGTWIVVGRDRFENQTLTELAGREDIQLYVPGAGSPITLVRYATGEESVATAARLCARYSDRKKEPLVTVQDDGSNLTIDVEPAPESLLARLRLY